MNIEIGERRSIKMVYPIEGTELNSLTYWAIKKSQSIILKLN